MEENNSHLLIKPKLNSSVYQSITKESVGWKYLNFEARKLNLNEEFIWNTHENEMVVVLLSGNYKFKSNSQNFETTNGRKNVFQGVAHTLYIPRRTKISITATSKQLDIAYGWCKSDMDYPLKLIKPDETQTVIFGGDNATRQFNDLIPPGFGCSKIVVREVYTPSGNWSSFPAHKHDERILDVIGNVL